MALSLAVEWELLNGELKPYSFNVAESLDSFNAQLARFRQQLFGWFAAVAVIMLFSISLVMRGVLRPLRQIEDEIRDVEEGRRQELSDDFPTELTAVARNMNLLIGSERARSERYRNTLGNLAHSLKTPLAAIRTVLSEQDAANLTERIEHQIERMNDIVRYQLRKPATLTTDNLGLKPIAVDTELARLVDGLRKVYKDKNPLIELDIEAGVLFRGDIGDFLEIAGNLLDNACKWCDRRVALAVRRANGGLRIVASDDGAGIPQEVAELLLKRGMRLDESAPGQGIGLAVVKDIAASYGGDISIGRSSFGGAKVSVTVNT
jgi:two-component system sensor histidine kinase PhoQ